MADTSYADLDEFKERISVPLSDAAHDGMLQQLLNTAAIAVDKYTRGSVEGNEAFSESASQTRYFNDYIGRDARIDDNLTVTLLQRGGVTVTTTYYQLWPYNVGTGPRTTVQYRPDCPSPANNQWYKAGVGLRQLAITGTWGYCKAADRPPAIKEATLGLATLGYQKRAIGPKEVLAMLQNPYNADTKYIRSMLEPYRSWGRPAIV